MTCHLRRTFGRLHYKVRIMIQRIQSLFLLLAALATLSLFLIPFATADAPVEASQLFNDGKYSVMDNSGLMALFSMSALLALAALFAYTNRKRQIMLTRVAIGADVFGLGAVVFFGLTDPALPEGVGSMLSFGLAMPVIAVVLMVLAFRAIHKDEKLVRSMNRLR